MSMENTISSLPLELTQNEGAGLGVPAPLVYMSAQVIGHTASGR